MWAIKYNDVGRLNEAFFSVCKISDEDKKTRAEQPQLTLTGLYDANVGASDTGSNGEDEFSILDEIDGDDELDEVSLEKIETENIQVVKSAPDSNVLDEALNWHLETSHEGNFPEENREEKTTKADAPKAASFEGNRGHIFLAGFVRFMLIGHNVITVWRVTEAYNDNVYWLVTLANLLLILEGLLVILRRSGVEYSWWCPCFLIYLASTIPAIWLLQLDKHDRYVASLQAIPIAVTSPAISSTTGSPLWSAMTTTATFISVTSYLSSGVTAMAKTTATFLPVTILQTNISATTPVDVNASVTANPSLMTTNATGTLPSTVGGNSSSSTSPATTTDQPPFGMLNDDIWVIIVEEAMVYLLVLCRWLMPRGKITRDFLADLLLEFLAIASDIMELLAVFDQDEVRGNLKLTYVILAVWSASFIQFIPILMFKRRFRKPRKPDVKCLNRVCGTKFVEFTVTCMSIFLQDLPFLVVRLYIIVEVNLITYSLVFFLLKNIVSLLLLFYRLVVICCHLPMLRKCRI